MSRTCPCCGQDYEDYPAISRKDNRTEICSTCGIIEALQAYEDAKPRVYTVYSQEGDMTFIMEEDQHSVSVKGFYFGEPDEEATKKLW